MFSPFLAHHTVQRGGVYTSVQRKGTCDNVLFLLWKGIEDSFLLPGQFCRIVVPAPVISHEDHRDVFQIISLGLFRCQIPDPGLCHRELLSLGRLLMGGDITLDLFLGHPCHGHHGQSSCSLKGFVDDCKIIAAVFKKILKNSSVRMFSRSFSVYKVISPADDSLCQRGDIFCFLCRRFLFLVFFRLCFGSFHCRIFFGSILLFSLILLFFLISQLLKPGCICRIRPAAPEKKSSKKDKQQDTENQQQPVSPFLIVIVHCNFPPAYLLVFVVTAVAAIVGGIVFILLHIHFIEYSPQDLAAAPL